MGFVGTHTVFRIKRKDGKNFMDFNKYFDHTILKMDASGKQVEKICKEALKYNFASVCVNQYRTKMAAQLLKDSDVKVCTVVGFPLGAVTTEVKIAETKLAIADGAEEIDMVINVGALKDKDYLYVMSDIKAVKEVCKDKVLKVIIETCLLDEEEKKKACELSVEAGADYVKTSTGFSVSGAKAEDVALMKRETKGFAKVKAAGGIHSYEDAMEMIEAGADRLGTSATINIWEEYLKV